MLGRQLLIRREVPVGFSDVLRRLGLLRPREEPLQRGIRRQRLPDRRPEQQTERLGTPAMGPPAAAPDFAARGPLPTVVSPRLDPPAPAFAPPPVLAPAPVAHPSPRPPAAPPTPPQVGSGDAGATRYVAIPGAGRGRVVGVLVAVEGELAGEVYRLFEGESRIGRSADCEVATPSEWISRVHARILYQDGQFAIAPLSEKNPTFVNDERTEGSELSDGDFVRLGRTTFRFRSIA